MKGEDFNALGVQWLRDRAKTLRRDAGGVERAYTRGPMFRVCQQVAAAYRKAADQLDSDAGAMAGETYTCSNCGDEFESDRPDEEARQEAKNRHGADTFERREMAVVCDPCFQRINQGIH